MSAELENFLSVSQFNKFVDMFSKEKLPHNTKFDNVCVRLYLQIRIPNKLHAGLSQISYSLVVILELSGVLEV